MVHRVSLERERNPAWSPRRNQTMTTSTDDLAVGAQDGSATASTADGERADLLATLAQHRHFLRFTARDLTDEHARQRTTVSELTVGGLIKHVTSAERGWTNFIVAGTSGMADAAGFNEG